MTAELLQQQLQRAATALREVPNSLSLFTSSLPSGCTDKLESLESIAAHLASVCGLIEIREVARHFLHQLPLQRVPLNPLTGNLELVNYQGEEIPFSTARLLAFQSYLAITWSVCDSITTVLAPLVCSQHACNDRGNPPQLLTHFIKSDKNTAYYSSFLLAQSYGFPVGISYIIRNHFIHDGALFYGQDFFESQSISDKFRISQSGWKVLEDGLKKHGLIKTQTRALLLWPWHQDDLLQLLELCSDEMDEALEYLIDSSVASVLAQARYLLKRDANLS